MARVYPLALPTAPYATDRGSFASDGQQIVLRQKGEASRIWLPLLVSWDRTRNRKPARWRSAHGLGKVENLPAGGGVRGQDWLGIG